MGGAVSMSCKSSVGNTCFSFDDKNSSPVVSIDSLSTPLLMALCQGDILAIRIPGFCLDSACRHISDNMVFDRGLVEHYDNAPDLDIYRMGMSYFETRFNRSLLETYFSHAEGFLSRLDQLCPDGSNPLADLIRLLKQVWPAGADIQQHDGRPMMPGLVRVLLEGQGFSPHQDMLVRDVPGLSANQAPLAQLPANIYVQNFEQGGDLELGDSSPDDQEVLGLYSGKHDFIDRDLLPPVSTTLRPQAGELILCRSDKVHAVTAGKGGMRIAFSCFAAYRGLDKPLTYWI